MNFENLKFLYIVFCVSLCVVVLLPALSTFIAYPTGEEFSDMWVLGSDHIIGEYPYNILAGEPSRVFLGVGNHLGRMEYYLVTVKLRNQTDAVADVAGTPDSSSPIFEYRVFLNDADSWEKTVTFSFEGVLFNQDISTVSKFYIDGYSVNVDKTAAWDSMTNGFYYQLLFELWVYNSAIGGFEFNNHSLQLWFNISQPV